MMPYASAPKADGPVIRLVEPENEAEPVKSVASFKSEEPENAPENKPSEKPENQPLFVQKIKQFEQRNPIKGFKESGFKITKKKVITAAVCLALASTVVVPMAIILGKKRK